MEGLLEETLKRDLKEGWRLFLSCRLDIKNLVEKHMRGSVGEWYEQERPGKRELMKMHKGKCNYFCTKLQR